MALQVRLKDPVSALTHWLGAALAIAGLVALLVATAPDGTRWQLVSFAVFGASMIMLYTASAVYHSVPERGTGKLNLVLRKLDHIMIYILIAGTYTPFCLIPLRGVWGWSLFAAIWACAVGGFFLKLFWMSAPRWLYTGIYVMMGWLIVVATYPLLQTVSRAGLLWLLAGGLAYTFGAVLYATKWPKLWPGVFSFHEVWHLFVMAGTICHFFSIYTLV
ncbi:MAG TPA: hemolysin III family protein [Symbiobacteriaceae bacterium]|jgi:hemolysin III|nr:hemolysin III family protein [Symbiobacteriaceae bacterium]